MGKFYKLIIIIFLIMLTIALYLHKDSLNQDPGLYIGSEKCQNCHQTQHSAWHETLHSKMFKPVENQEEILGDFDSHNPLVTFKKDAIDFVIGSQWEQVYARMIDGEYYPFTAKWLVLTQQWVPYKVKNWKETPLSIKCNGCHTTGFNPQTYEFSEFGIGCEACHGPGNLHVQNQAMKTSVQCSLCHTNNNKHIDKQDKKDIIVSYKSAVCGQCHSRGSQAVDNEHMKIKFNFPVEYIPGNEMNAAFKPLTQNQDKKGQFWWGNGISKNRHQEYADFALSKPAKSLKNLKEKRSKSCGEPQSDCLQCHSTDYRMADNDNKPSLDEAKEGITCIACHEPHGIDQQYLRNSVGANKCEECHTDNLSRSTMKSGKPHTPCPTGKVQCADCHMPKIVSTGGAFSLRSHAFKIIPPEATEKYQMPNSCQNGNCHKDKDLQWAKNAYRDYYLQ